MPRYDRKCQDCAWTAIDLWEPSDSPRVSCPDCGAPTERAWLQPAAILRDEIDLVQHNGTKDPIRFRSRIERNRWLKQHYYRESGDGTSKGSKSGACMDPQTQMNAASLVARASAEPAKVQRDPSRVAIGITSDEGVIRYLSDQNRVQNRGEFGFGDR